MLKYLIIQLDDTAVSYCHYNNGNTKSRLIELDVLKKAIFWAMKENVIVQFLYPDYPLPATYKEAISVIDHVNIVASTCEDKELLKNADVVILDTWASIDHFAFDNKQTYVIRTTFADLFTSGVFINTILPKISRINIVITDPSHLDSEIEYRYSQFLETLGDKITQEYKGGHGVQVNILTDRIMLDTMNNCEAGVENVTLAPNGNFYICPGFYLDGSTEIGNPDMGIAIKNNQLYQIDYAPICRICDAWHCKRCIWQNKNATMEINTPGREQCIISHIERQASRRLLSKIRSIGIFQPEKEIMDINYLDPFDKLQEIL